MGWWGFAKREQFKAGALAKDRGEMQLMRSTGNIGLGGGGYDVARVSAMSSDA